MIKNEPIDIKRFLIFQPGVRYGSGSILDFLNFRLKERVVVAPPVGLFERSESNLMKLLLSLVSPFFFAAEGRKRPEPSKNYILL